MDGSSVRRIGFFGSACAGKSTMAARVFSSLKSLGLKQVVELVPEYIKIHAYEGRFPSSFGQLETFTGQLYSEDRLLKHVDVVVSDSPVLMAVSYAQYYKFVGADELLSLARKFEHAFPSLNFYLHPKFDYQSAGRFQTADEAVKIGDHIYQLLKRELPNQFYEINDHDEIITKILSVIGG